MAFTVQDDQGTVDGANSYASEAFFVAYHSDRGNTYTATSEEIEQALVKATDYLDQRFTFIGEKPNQSQTTEWPRLDAEDRNDNLRFGVPEEIKESTAEYALIALTSELNPSPTRDESGALVSSKTDRVGPLEETRAYANAASLSLPRYPKADQKLISVGLVVVGRILRRA